MTADSIIQLITVLLGSGGLITIFLVSEKKTAAMLENMAKANEEWKKIIDRQTEETRRSAASTQNSKRNSTNSLTSTRHSIKRLTQRIQK